MNILNKIEKKIAEFTFKKKAVISSKSHFVSFTFDDVPSSAFTNGMKLLDEHQFKGTFYLALSFLNAASEPAYSKEQVQSCLDSDHEIGCHTYSHQHIFQSNTNFFMQDLQQNRSEFEKLFPVYKMENFSYPFGEQTWSLKKHVGKNYTSNRSIEQGINVGNVDLNSLKTIRLYEGSYPIEQIQQKLDDFKKSGGWLIFYTHDVQENYSKYGCSPGYLNQVIELVLKQGFYVSTIKDIVKKVS